MDNQRPFSNWNISIIYWRFFQTIFHLTH